MSPEPKCAGFLLRLILCRGAGHFGGGAGRAVADQLLSASLTGESYAYDATGKPHRGRRGHGRRQSSGIRWCVSLRLRRGGEPHGDTNLFRYVGNAPLDRVDPSGLMAKWAQQAARASVPATGWASLGLTTSGVTPPRPTAVSPTPVSTYSLLSTGTSSARQAAAPSTPALVSQPFASLVTTGRAAPAAQQAVESPRWTSMDRIAKMAADAAYNVKDGGLLKEYLPEYDPTGSTGKYGKWGFSATLSRATDYDPSASENLYIMAFRGTRSWFDWRDWLANVVQLGTRTSQFEQSNEATEIVKGRLPPNAELMTTGHSKAGAQAVGASFATGVRAIVFNPSSLSGHYRHGTAGDIRTHVTFGDPLSILRTLQNIFEIADPPGMRDFRSPLGEVIVHPPRSIDTHSLDSLPR